MTGRFKRSVAIVSLITRLGIFTPPAYDTLQTLYRDCISYHPSMQGTTLHLCPLKDLASGYLN